MPDYPTNAQVVAELRRLASHPSTIRQAVPEFFALVADRLQEQASPNIDTPKEQ